MDGLIARKNLILSIFAENIGLKRVLVGGHRELATAIVLPLSELFWLTAAPNLIGSFLRIPYTFAVPRFGGRLRPARSGPRRS